MANKLGASPQLISTNEINLILSITELLTNYYTTGLAKSSVLAGIYYCLLRQLFPLPLLLLTPLFVHDPAELLVVLLSCKSCTAYPKQRKNVSQLGGRFLQQDCIVADKKKGCRSMERWNLSTFFSLPFVCWHNWLPCLCHLHLYQRILQDCSCTTAQEDQKPLITSEKTNKLFNRLDKKQPYLNIPLMIDLQSTSSSSHPSSLDFLLTKRLVFPFP